MSLFEKASREKYRFETVKGNLSVEDLWDLPLVQPPRSKQEVPNLDDIAKGLYRTIKSADDVESFVLKNARKDTITPLKLEIVKHIIAVRMAEDDAAAKRKENAERKAKLLALIAQKEDESDLGKSREELMAELQTLADGM